MQSQVINSLDNFPLKPSRIGASTKSPSRKVSVFFSKNIEIRDSLCLDEYSNEEYNSYWYSSDEYETIEKDMYRQIMKMEAGKVLHDKKSCSRGLERYLTVNAISKRENQSAALKAALKEQYHQMESDHSGEEAIAKAYHNVSSSCQMWATVLGLRDQREAAKYLDDEDEDDYWKDLKRTTPSQESQKSSIQEKHVATQKDGIPTTIRPMTSLQQVAVSARTA